MEIQKITYDTKKYIRNDPNYPKTQTITDEDMNEIKSVVNNNAYKQDEDYLKLKNALINAETEESKSLHVTDANKFGQLEVLGNQEQETRSGKNLFKLPDSGNNNGITYTNNGDGTFNISGTATEQASFSIVVPLENSGFEQGKNYTISSNIEIGNVAYYVHSATSDGYWNKTLLDFRYETTKTKVMPEPSTDYISLNIVVPKDVTLNYQNVTVQIEEGTEATEYEQYGASPSPDYPSEVKCLGSNKQLFDKDNANKINATPSGLVIVAGSSGAKSFYLEVKPNTDYTISRKIVGKRFLAATSVEVPVVGTSLTQNIINNDGDEINIKTGANDKYLLVYYLYNNSENEEEILSNIKVEEGTEATSYSPYGQGSTLISKINKNVLEKPENSTSSGVGITVNYENGKYIINGMTTEGCYLKLNKELLANTFAQSSNWQKSKLKPGEYVFSIKTISGNTNSENINIFLRNATSKAVFNQEIDKVSKPGSLSKSFLIEEEQDYFCYLWMPGSITFTNFTFSVMLEKGTELTELTENQQTDYILNIQQEMLEGDYFIKEDDGWKEVHNWNKYVFSGNESIAGAGVSNVYYMSSITDYIISEENICISNYFKSINNVEGAGSLTDEDNVICFNNNHTNYRLYIKSSQYASSTELKEFLQQKNTEGNPAYVTYKTTTPTKLACTEEQSVVLEELSNLDLFDGVNNIITAEDIALLKLKYALDVKTYVNNQLANVNQQILEMAGGN